MEKTSQKSLWFLATAFVALAVFANIALAQEKPAERNISALTNERYVISANAGLISVVSGKVLVARENYLGKDILRKDNQLKEGERVRTEANGKVEVLLNPGSYLRVAENSEFSFEDTSLDNVRVNLAKGTAIFEVATSRTMQKDGFKIEVNTPNAKVFLKKSGIYRLNILPDNTTEVLVWKGEARIGSETANAVKGRKRIIVSGENQTFAKLDKKEIDNFDMWSNLRAEVVAKLNDSLRDRELSNSLYGYSGWSSMGNNLGVWVFDNFARRYCFLPFNGYWNSPYGFGYSSYYPWWRYPVYTNGGGTNNNAPDPHGARPIITRNPPSSDTNARGNDNERARDIPQVRRAEQRIFDNDDSFSSPGVSRPSSSSSESARPIVIAPSSNSNEGARPPRN